MTNQPSIEPITREEREKTLQRFWDRYYDNRLVCSPAQNYCRNNYLMDEAGLRLSELQTALSASEAREKKLREALDYLINIEASAWSLASQPDALTSAARRARQALGE